MRETAARYDLPCHTARVRWVETVACRLRVRSRGRRRPCDPWMPGNRVVRDGEREYDEDMARDGTGSAARLHLPRRTTARGEAGHETSPRCGAALCRVRPAAGPSDARAAAGRPAGARVPALPPGGVAAAAPGAPGSGAGRAPSGRGRSDRPDRAAGERLAARGEIPAALPVAPGGAGGGAPSAGVGLTVLPPIPRTGLLGSTLRGRYAT